MKRVNRSPDSLSLLFILHGSERTLHDHGLPLAMYPRREICVTLEVATGVGGGIGTKEDRRGNRTTSQLNGWLFRRAESVGGKVEMETVLSVCSQN